MPSLIPHVCVFCAGDAWDAFLYDTSCQPPYCDAAAGKCGTPLASLFFLPFMLVCSFLLLSILVAVVVEAFKMTRDPPQVTPENFQQYKSLWMALDPEVTGFINVEQASQEIALLRPGKQPAPTHARSCAYRTGMQADGALMLLSPVCLPCDGGVVWLPRRLCTADLRGTHCPGCLIGRVPAAASASAAAAWLAEAAGPPAGL